MYAHYGSDYAFIIIYTVEGERYDALHVSVEEPKLCHQGKE